MEQGQPALEQTLRGLGTTHLPVVTLAKPYPHGSHERSKNFKGWQLSAGSLLRAAQFIRVFCDAENYCYTTFWPVVCWLDAVVHRFEFAFLRV